MKKYLILVLAALFVFKILTISIIDIRLHKLCPIVPSTETISQKETDLFLIHFHEYVSRGYAKKIPEDFLHDATKPTERLPWIVKLWFDKNCINPQRFYYVEQRLRSILKAHELKKHGQAVINVLQTQIKDDMSDDEKEWYRGLIEEQKQLAKVEGVTEEELLMVKDREEQIAQVLK